MYNKIILYTTHCPMCKALRTRLDQKKIEYEVCEDVDLMVEKGFKRAPILEVDGNTLSYKEAILWLEDKQI